MMLFMNVFVTGNANTPYDRGLLPAADRLHVFKYSLASMAAIPFTKAFLYVQLDDKYADQKDALEDYCRGLFGDRLVMRHFRIDKQSGWQTAMEEVFAEPDELVWFSCNDDHVFLDYDLDVLNAMTNRLQVMMKKHEHVAAYISHWPEMLCHVSYGIQYPIQAVHEESFEVDWINIDSIQIVNKAVLKHWWLAHDYGEDVFLIRTDGNLAVLGPKYIHIKTDLSVRTLIPMREICRHFDGYSRPYMAGGSADINRCPPLTIPEGFWDRDVKVAFCKEARLPGYVNVHPCLANHSSVDPNGADCKWMLEDLPLFWRDRLSDLAFGPEFDRSTLIYSRNKAVQDIANSERVFLTVSKPVPMDWLKVAYR